MGDLILILSGFSAACGFRPEFVSSSLLFPFPSGDQSLQLESGDVQEVAQTSRRGLEGNEVSDRDGITLGL